MSKLQRPADPSAILPDGTVFQSWEVPLEFSRTYHVAGSNPRASDDNDGSQARPFKTIQRAAEVVEPGQRVVIGKGVYREWVRPVRGGEGPDRMISYEAAPGAKVVLKGSEVFAGPWRESSEWADENRGAKAPAGYDGHARLWAAKLPREWFRGYLPFAMVCVPQHYLEIQCFGIANDQWPVYLRKRGLVFQDGRRLRQVSRFADLRSADGTYWPESTGLTVHVRPFGDVGPAGCTFEFTAREQVFAPETLGLPFIRVQGLSLEHAADGFPWPQRAALSASQGHHWIIEGNTVRSANACGIDIGMQHPRYVRRPVTGHQIVRGNTVEDCGICGITGTVLPLVNTLVEGNRVAGCCWHDIESLFETAGMKFHQTHNCLFRRNVVLGTSGGSGIWLDAVCENSRVTGNVIVGVRSLFGGVFLELSRDRANSIDHNILWDIQGNGVYEHDCDRLVIAHNLIGRCTGAGVCLKRGDPKRFAGARGSTGRKHRVLNNLLFDNARQVEYPNPDNTADGNAYGPAREPGAFRIEKPDEYLDLRSCQEFHGLDAASREVKVEADLNAKTLKLKLKVTGDLPACARLDGMTADFLGAARAKTTIPGPFAELPPAGKAASIDVAPRA